MNLLNQMCDKIESKGEKAYWYFIIPGLVIHLHAFSRLNASQDLKTILIVMVLYVIGAVLSGKGFGIFTESLNRSRNYKWLGIVSFLGIIIVMCLDKKKVKAVEEKKQTVTD